MLKKINWRLVFNTFAWVISLSGLFVLMSFIEKEKTELTCKSVKVLLPGNQFFIEQAEVYEILNANNKELVGKRLCYLNLQSLEDKLKANPFILFAKVYADMDGIIHAEIKQRVPILRIFNNAGQDFYVDENGLKIPLSSHFTARVLAANGNINEIFNGKIDTLKTQIGKSVFAVANFIAKDTLWNEQIEQIFITQNHNIQLVPRLGNQTIILGNADSLSNKFRNLLIFYKKAMPKAGWQTYRTINLSYSGQIVCEKRDTINFKVDTLKLVKADSLTKKNTINKSIKDTIKKIQ
ncbi:MAG: cell division protein FtsQ [Sphingobacteriales bacterium]|nr:MAG: cell division protein FtsQ [Sphingobacteriales bacterium]